MRRALAIGVLLLLAAAPCPARQFVARAHDFKCLLKGRRPAGKNFFVFHRSRRKLARAIAIAEQDMPGKRYPVGTIIQLFPFEAMAKRGGRYNPEGHGWEFFRLDVTPRNKTAILTRGGAEVRNFASCQGCHLTGRAADFDLICEGHGALRLPFSDQQIRAVQAADPRCKPAH